jgi:hypothetical protein
VDEGIGGWWCEAVSLGTHLSIDLVTKGLRSVGNFALIGLWPHDLSSATVCMYKVFG